MAPSNQRERRGLAFVSGTLPGEAGIAYQPEMKPDVDDEAVADDRAPHRDGELADQILKSVAQCCSITSDSGHYLSSPPDPAFQGAIGRPTQGLHQRHDIGYTNEPPEFGR